MLSIFRGLMKNDRGGAAIEYTLVISLIAIAAIASMKTIGGKLTSMLGSAAIQLT